MENNEACCAECGTKLSGQSQMSMSSMSGMSFHSGTCSMCGEKKPVTSMKNYLNLKRPENSMVGRVTNFKTNIKSRDRLV
jgi:hypothetical protein